ncbi:MAG: hypothetical protein OSB03_07140 [Vicinamibacterales bacterium]|jgi:hypothetical protein|nr:hypothetical protein [Vicinamibacterales bacterium]
MTARGQIRPWHGRPQFALYLFLTVVLTVDALLTSRCGSLDIHTFRYTLHTLLVVVGLVAGFLATEPSQEPDGWSCPCWRSGPSRRCGDTAVC